MENLMKAINTIPFPRIARNDPKRDETGSIYRLRVELKGVKPIIYRVLKVRGDIELDLLHAVLQIATGWTNSHLHKFRIDGSEYSDPEFNLNEDAFVGQKFIEDEAIVNLVEVAPNKGFQFDYYYDFGDSWEHRVTVEDILPNDCTLAGFAECIDGERACPPENCGGIPGYDSFLEIMSDPENKEHEFTLEWIGGAFNSESFDIRKVNRYLKKIKWEHPTIEQLGEILLARDEIRPVRKKTAKRKSTKTVKK